MDAHDVLVKYLHVPEGDAGGWVTFRPSLVRALLHMARSDGPIAVLELGTGPGSSPMLAELAATGAARVLAVESDPAHFGVASALDCASYDAKIGTLADVDTAAAGFDVVLVDHAPVAARARDLALLAKMDVGLVVVHDWNCDVYGYDKSLFRWRVEDRGRWPNTAILSNTVDLSDWLGCEMTRYDETIKAWDVAARRPDRASAIHPSGVQQIAYFESGRAAANVVRGVAHDYVPSDAPRLLDYGCGDGRVLRHLTEDFAIVGYDTSPAMRDAARHWFEVAASDVVVGTLTQHDDFFDLAFSFAVFIHHKYDDGADMLRSIAGAVRVGGIVAVDIPLYDVAREPLSWTDVGVWTQPQLLEAAQLAGLELLECHASPGAFAYDAVGPNHGRLQILRRVR